MTSGLDPFLLKMFCFLPSFLPLSHNYSCVFAPNIQLSLLLQFLHSQRTAFRKRVFLLCSGVVLENIIP